MSSEITLTIPAIDESAVIANLEQTTTQAVASELEAVRALREKYGSLAKHNGYIKIASFSRSTVNYSVDREMHYEINGHKVKALLAGDYFDREHDDQNRGSYTGDRLYLTEHATWLRIERDGHWTRWEGEANWWGCGASADPRSEDDSFVCPVGGDVRTLTDEQVVDEYRLDEMVTELGSSLKTLAEKLPQRMAKLQQRTELAGQLLTALAQGGSK